MTFLLFGANGLGLHFLNPVPAEADLITLTGVVKQVNVRIPHVELVLSDGSLKGVEFPGNLMVGGDPGRYQSLPLEEHGLKVRMDKDCEAIVKGRPMRGAWRDRFVVWDFSCGTTRLTYESARKNYFRLTTNWISVLLSASAYLTWIAMVVVFYFKEKKQI